MDKIIKSLIEILAYKHKGIADLLIFSRHNLDISSNYGRRLFSQLTSFEIISPPIQTSKLNDLDLADKTVIKEAVLLIYPLQDNAPEIVEIIFKADPNLAKENEFVQYIDDEEIINDISKAINLLERKPPKFWLDYKADLNSLLEDDYRSEFFRMLGMRYFVGSEEESKIGRTDLMIKSTSLNRKVFEFKVWNRNDYLETTTQLLGYLTEIDDSGFVIMGNSRKAKNITSQEYEFIIKSPEYIDNSLQIKQTKHGIEYYEADYMFNDNRKKIFHFILNLK